MSALGTTVGVSIVRPRRSFLGVIALVIAFALFCSPQLAHAQGSTPLLNPAPEGCFDVEATGVALFGDGSGSATITPPDGEIVAVLLEWVGAEDTTPGGDLLDGTSVLMVNATPVTGTLAAPLDINGNAGYDPHAYVDSGPRGWFSWHADIGPTGLGIVPAHLDSALPITISGWDSSARQTNGATITVIVRPDQCAVENQLQFLTGVNWYHDRTPGHAFSELLVYPIEPEPVERLVRMVFSHAGTDHGQTSCRGGAIWMLADDGTASTPAPDEYDLVAFGDTNGDGVARGYGINGGVEVLNDPFTSPSLPCVPSRNPPPDEAYAPGHPYPGGAATAPYRAVAMNPESGGDVGEPGEWGVIEATVVVPAGARWIAFQLESEADQNGESGSWVGGGVFLIVPKASIGDRVWEDLDGNGLQDEGEPGFSGVRVALLDGGGATLATTTTDGDGFYHFTELMPGAYRLHFTAPDRYGFTTAHVENGPLGDAGDSDADPTSGLTPLTTLAVSEIDNTWDAGLVRLPPAIDIEKDPPLQVIAPGETAHFTMTVTNIGELDLTDVVVSDPQAPDCDRTIGELAAGESVSYTCTLAGVLQDMTNVATVEGVDSFGDEVTDEDSADVDVTPIIEVEKSADPTVIPGEAGTVTFSVQVTNTVLEALELVYLHDDVFGDLNGLGTCTVPQTLPVGGGYTCEFDALIVAGENGHRNVVTAIAEDDEGNEAVRHPDDATVDFVLPAHSSGVGDRVWHDSNANGLQDPGEQGVADILVNLHAADGTPLLLTTTDAQGYYRFQDLEAGDYYITFAVPVQFDRFSELTPPNRGTDDERDSDALPTEGSGLAGRTEVFSLAENEYDLSWDMGLLVPTAEVPSDEPEPQNDHWIYLPLIAR